MNQNVDPQELVAWVADASSAIYAAGGDPRSVFKNIDLNTICTMVNNRIGLVVIKPKPRVWQRFMSAFAH